MLAPALSLTHTLTRTLTHTLTLTLPLTRTLTLTLPPNQPGNPDLAAASRLTRDRSRTLLSALLDDMPGLREEVRTCYP